jgi:ubiquinone/menaquinone biosynthesis C-methylase UbiE
MRSVDYDAVAPAFDRRYAHNSFAGIERAVTRFVGSRRHGAIVEVGCGTGHWLGVLAGSAEILVGVDRSKAMLERARAANPRTALVRATAEHLPFATNTSDRVFCVNALHHFGDPKAFLRECRRILSAAGSFLTISLDPHTGLDTWWIYDYFPGALPADRQRYPSTEKIRKWLDEAGFATATTEIVHHVPAERPFELAVEQGFLDRRSTSQLMVISDSEYEAGMRRLRRDRPVLRSDLRLFGTTAHMQAASRAPIV